MTRDEFLVYLEDYNSGDPARLAGHYASDVVFENYGNRQSGDEVMGLLVWLGSVVQSRLEPRHILIDGDQIALEGEMYVTALADLPDLPIGALRRGDHKVSHTLVFYTTKGPLISHVRIAGWPPRDPESCPDPT